MTCRHGAFEPDPPRPWESDEDLMEFCGLPDTAEGRLILSNMDEAERLIMAEMRAACEQINRGEIPRGVIACDRVGRAVK